MNGNELTKRKNLKREGAFMSYREIKKWYERGGVRRREVWRLEIREITDYC